MKNDTSYNVSNNILRSSIRYREMLWKKEIVFTETHQDPNSESIEIILHHRRNESPNLQLGFIPKIDGDSIIFSPTVSLLKIGTGDIATNIINHMEYINIYKEHLEKGRVNSLEQLQGKTKTEAEELLFKRMMSSLETDIMAAKDSKFLKLAEKQVIQERLGQIDNEIAAIINKEKSLKEAQSNAKKDEIIEQAVKSIEELTTRNIYAEINFTMQGIEAITRPVMLTVDYSIERAWNRTQGHSEILNVKKGDTAYYCIGVFKITIPWRGHGISVVPVWRNKDTLAFQRGGHRDGHPHVSGGNPCLGAKGGKKIDKFMKEGNIKGALMHMYNFIHDYNPHDPYGHTPENLCKPYLSAKEALENAMAKQCRKTDKEEISDDSEEQSIEF